MTTKETTNKSDGDIQSTPSLEMWNNELISVKKQGEDGTWVKLKRRPYYCKDDNHQLYTRFLLKLAFISNLVLDLTENYVTPTNNYGWYNSQSTRLYHLSQRGRSDNCNTATIVWFLFIVLSKENAFLLPIVEQKWKTVARWACWNKWIISQ